jgi:hypothetical protein
MSWSISATGTKDEVRAKIAEQAEQARAWYVKTDPAEAEQVDLARIAISHQVAACPTDKVKVSAAGHRAGGDQAGFSVEVTSLRD